jgi:cytidine deaminase
MQTDASGTYPLNPDHAELFERASEVLSVRGQPGKNSVGAAVRTDKGIYVGLDLMSRKSAICAEPGAISAAYSAGSYSIQSIIAVCLRTDVSRIVSISPCGACRELLNFHAPDCQVLFEYGGSWIEIKAGDLFRYPVIFG